MKKITTIIFLIISFASYGQVSTVKVASSGGTSGGATKYSTTEYGMLTDSATTNLYKFRADSTVMESKASAVNRAALKQDVLQDINTNVGTFTNVTVNGKGLATAANNGVIQTYTTGSGINVNDPTTWVNVNPSNGVGQLNIVLPKNPVNGQRVDINFGGNISSQDSTLVYTLFMQGPIIGTKNFTGLTVDDQLAFRYNSATSKWYRVNDITPRIISTPPTISDALVWLDGTIIQSGGNYYFKDQSGNGRNFLITGYDFDSSLVKGFPYKSAATISAPSGDAILQAADLNSYWYTSGTANQIPVVSLFQDVDYEHKFFTRHKAQVVDSNDVEVYEPRVMDIVVYNTVKTGSNLAACQTYFNVPTEVTSNVIWVSKTGDDATGTGTKAAPWKTLIKADLSGTTGYTVYTKTGTYLENVGGNYWILNKTMAYKFIGYCTITSTWDRVVRLAAGNSTIEGMIIDGTNTMTHGLDIYSVGTKVSTLTRCLIKNCITNLVNGGTAIETLTFNNCVFVGYPTATRASQEVKISSPTVSGCYFVNAKTALYNIDCIFKNSKYFDNDKTYCVITIATGLNMYGNTINFKSGGISQTSTYSAAKNINIVRNKFTSSSLSGVAGTAINYTGTVNFFAKFNQFKSTITTSSTDGQFIVSGVTTGYKNEIDSNVFISKATTAFYHIAANGIGTKIRNNYSWSNSTVGIHISLGAENSATNTNDSSVVTGNRIIGFKLDNPATTTSSVHCLFIGGGINIKTAYNNISFTSLGIVVKTGSSAQAYTVEGVYNNVFNDCSSPIWIRGVSGLKIINNSIYFSAKSYGQSLGNVLLCDENAAIVGTQNSSNILFKNNIVDVKISTGTLVSYDAFAGANGCIAQNNVLNGGQYLLQDGTNYISLATAQGAGKLLNCVVQNPNLSASFIPATAIVIGENLGASYQAGLDISTSFGDEFIYPSIINRNQVSSGLWQVGAYVQ